MKIISPSLRLSLFLISSLKALFKDPANVPLSFFKYANALAPNPLTSSVYSSTFLREISKELNTTPLQTPPLVITSSNILKPEPLNTSVKFTNLFSNLISGLSAPLSLSH